MTASTASGAPPSWHRNDRRRQKPGVLGSDPETRALGSCDHGHERFDRLRRTACVAPERPPEAKASWLGGYGKITPEALP